MARRKAEQQLEAVPWGYERYTASDGSTLFTRSPATAYRALLDDLERGDSVTLTGERLAVAKQALSTALWAEETIKPREFRIVQALHATGSELRRLRAMRREFLGRTGHGRGAVIDIEGAVRDWRLLTDPTPLVDAEGRTWIPNALGYFGLVPRCPRHSPGRVPEHWCNECQEWITPASAETLKKLGRARNIDPRHLAVQALRRVHGFATDAGVVQALKRAGIRGLPAIGRRDT